IMGVPFYIRVWEQNEDENGKVTLTSKAYSMEYVKELISEKGAAVVWDEVSGQYYAEFTEGTGKFMIWVEDERSIDLKISLAHKYKLAGAAAWKRGLETEGIWEVFNRNLKTIQNYFEWKDLADING
ncbi:MAG: glycosyl hydrolase family 18 protein, partial [Eubacteriales bacterium]|nr:glycosyl hydrolase family 18 protein [Eubacteriales bacterium]